MEAKQPLSANTHSKSVICIHWLQSKCWKDENCPYLHSYEGARLPMCPAVARLGYCPYYSCHCRHPQSEKPCPRFLLGFCKFGPACTLAHVRSPVPPSGDLPDWYFNQMVAIFGLRDELMRDDSPSAGSTSTVSSRTSVHVLICTSKKCLKKDYFKLRQEQVRTLLIDVSRSADKVILVFGAVETREIFGLAEMTELKLPSRCYYTWLKRCVCPVPTAPVPGLLSLPSAEDLQALIAKQEPYHRRSGKDAYRGYHEYQALCQKYVNT